MLCLLLKAKRWLFAFHCLTFGVFFLSLSTFHLSTSFPVRQIVNTQVKFSTVSSLPYPPHSVPPYLVASFLTLRRVFLPPTTRTERPDSGIHIKLKKKKDEPCSPSTKKWRPDAKIVCFVLPLLALFSPPLSFEFHARKAESEPSQHPSGCYQFCDVLITFTYSFYANVSAHKCLPT